MSPFAQILGFLLIISSEVVTRWALIRWSNGIDIGGGTLSGTGVVLVLAISVMIFATILMWRVFHVRGAILAVFSVSMMVGGLLGTHDFVGYFQSAKPPLALDIEKAQRLDGPLPAQSFLIPDAHCHIDLCVTHRSTSVSYDPSAKEIRHRKRTSTSYVTICPVVGSNWHETEPVGVWAVVFGKPDETMKADLKAWGQGKKQPPEAIRVPPDLLVLPFEALEKAKQERRLLAAERILWIELVDSIEATRNDKLTAAVVGAFPAPLLWLIASFFVRRKSRGREAERIHQGLP